MVLIGRKIDGTESASACASWGGAERTAAKPKNGLRGRICRSSAGGVSQLLQTAQSLLAASEQISSQAVSQQ